MAVPHPKVEPLAGNRYRLVEDYIYQWQHEGVPQRLIVPLGFTCDLASVPRLLWWYISPFDLGAAAVPHDWIYRYRGELPGGSHQRWRGDQWQEVGAPWTREQADRLFARMMREGGVERRKRRWAYRAVRWFGGGSWGGGSALEEGVPHEL